METNKFENWKPKGKWVYDKTGSTFIGCHCVTPYDDCGCDDCQERHGYSAWYNSKERCFYENRNGLISITAYVAVDGYIYKTVC